MGIPKKCSCLISRYKFGSKTISSFGNKNQHFNIWKNLKSSSIKCLLRKVIFMHYTHFYDFRNTWLDLVKLCLITNYLRLKRKQMYLAMINYWLSVYSIVFGWMNKIDCFNSIKMLRMNLLMNPSRVSGWSVKKAWWLKHQSIFNYIVIYIF